MAKYKCTLTAEFEIEAENIVHARRVAARIKSVGETIGGRWIGRFDWVRHDVRRVSETRTVRREVLP